MLGVQHQPIRAAPDCDAAHRLTERARAALRSLAPQPRADVRFGLRGKYAAAPFAQALLIFEPTQLFCGIHRRLTIGPHAQPAVHVEKAGGVEEAVA